MKDEKKWVAYTTSVGRTHRGVYPRHVHVVGDLAFVLRGSGQADVLPKANVFPTQAAANAYLAGTGRRRWVVSNADDVPAMFEAYVIYATTERYGRRSGAAFIRRVDNGEDVKDWRVEVFDTKKKAESRFRKWWREAVNVATRSRADADKALAALAAVKPASKKGKAA